MRKFFDKHRHFVFYVIIGTIATIIDMSIFFFFTDVINLHYLPSNIISVFFGILTSYELNSRYNFKKRNYILKRFASFATICLIGMILGSLLLTIFYVWLGLPKFMAKIISVIIAGIFQYLFNKNITFRS